MSCEFPTGQHEFPHMLSKGTAAVSQAQGLGSPENQLLPHCGHHEMWMWAHVSTKCQQALPTCSVPQAASGPFWRRWEVWQPQWQRPHCLMNSLINYLPISSLFCQKKPREVSVASPTDLSGRKAETNPLVDWGGKLLTAKRSTSAVFPQVWKEMINECVSSSDILIMTQTPGFWQPVTSISEIWFVFLYFEITWCSWKIDQLRRK